MTHEQEIIRWAKSLNRTKVWCKSDLADWSITHVPRWTDDTIYIVDDIHAELRKLQADKPETKFELLSKLKRGEWVDTDPGWQLDREYRVKAEPKTETYYEVVVENRHTTDWYISNELFTQCRIDEYKESIVKTGRTFELPKAD